ncbi:MAG: nucleotide sugar dehydrogenase [Phycisphaeraceae bacterium]|nr:nucleotide sugar dehydrogenase [Phycisphaerae bacterium]MBX3391601.1 nucleotide sugar dehydrogenase [Phycisphaeraceae bacterium]
MPLRRLLTAFSSRQARVGVVGLGYVGLPLVRAMHAAGHAVVGFDIDSAKIDLLKAGQGYLRHLGDDLFTHLAASHRFTPTSDPRELATCDAIALCVPTPLGPHREPDLSYVINSTRMVAGILRPGMLVCLESTSYPGTTRDLCLPILAEAAGTFSGNVGRDFFLVFSPEREDPGRKDIQTHQIPRLVGGITTECTQAGVAFYASAVERVIPVESAEVAEAAKLLENTYRAVNIALVNELKTILTPMGIDIWSVIKAASTKPFGFHPFHPGPGLGGHCIPIDPYYLAWKAREIGRPTRFIELAGEINHAMPNYVLSRLAEALNADGKPLRGAKILILGIAYKPDIDDVRETPAAPIIDLLADAGAEVSYHDPHVPTFPSMRRHAITLASRPLDRAALLDHDAVVIVTNHSGIDYELVGRHAGLVIDTRDAMANVTAPAARVIKA